MITDQVCDQRRIRLWFGPHVIADFTAETATAKRYAAAIKKRFPGLRISDEPHLPEEVGPGTPAVAPRALPPEQLWGLTP